MRTTIGERAALDALIARWTEERSADDLLLAPGAGPTLWFRVQVRRLAADAGIAIVEPGASAPSPSPARRSTATTPARKAASKAAAKVAKKGARKPARKPSR